MTHVQSPSQQFSVDELKKLIDDSFLTPRDKEAMRQALLDQGAAESFLAIFDQALAKELERRNEMTETLAGELDSQADQNADQFKQQAKAIEEELNRALVAAGDNAQAQDAAWSAYYASLDELRKNHQNANKSLLVDLMQRGIQKIAERP